MWLEGPDWEGVSVRFSTRCGGVSEGRYRSLNLGTHVGDVPDAVAMNRARVSANLPDAPLWLEQVHGIEVLDADNLPAHSHTEPTYQADAAMTTTPGRVLAIMVADCLPVAITNAEGTVIGAAHAGWKGLAAGVLEETVLAIRRAQPTATTELRAWIGPAIGPSAFEVGDDVVHAFTRTDPESLSCFVARAGVNGKWWADLPALAERRLRRAGVNTISQANRCTFSEPDQFFSYRRDGQTGRMALFVSLAVG